MRRSVTFFLMAVVIGLLGDSGVYADTISTWTGAAGNTDWSVAGNWMPTVVPNNSASTKYAVTIGSGGFPTLDISPTIDSLTLDGVLFAPSSGPAPLLTVAKQATINGSLVFGGDFTQPTTGPGSISVGGNLNITSSAQFVSVQGSVNVGHDFANSSSRIVQLVSTSSKDVFQVGGILTNGPSGIVVLGTGRCLALCPPPPGGYSSGFAPGPVTSMGKLVNNGQLYLLEGTTVTLTNQPNGITHIRAGSVLDDEGTILAGSSSGLAHLTSVDGSLGMAGQGPISVTPLGGTLSIGGSLLMSDGNTLNVSGDLTNTGTINTTQDFSHGIGYNYLTVSGTMTNAANAKLSVGAFDHFSAGTLVNDGSASFLGSSITARTLKNGGAITFQPTETRGPPLVPVGFLNVGTGNVAPGYYNQFADGVLDELLGGTSSYGTIAVGDSGHVSLDGTLDIMLRNGFVPTIGESFPILTFTPGGLSGTFKDVSWDAFDGGRGSFLVSYNNAAGDVVVTAEAEAVPEPSTLLLVAPALGYAFWIYRRRIQNIRQ